MCGINSVIEAPGRIKMLLEKIFCVKDSISTVLKKIVVTGLVVAAMFLVYIYMTSCELFIPLLLTGALSGEDSSVTIIG